LVTEEGILNFISFMLHLLFIFVFAFFTGRGNTKYTFLDAQIEKKCKR
jgi:hypothetical protein